MYKNASKFLNNRQQPLAKFEVVVNSEKDACKEFMRDYILYEQILSEFCKLSFSLDLSNFNLETIPLINKIKNLKRNKLEGIALLMKVQSANEKTCTAFMDAAKNNLKQISDDATMAHELFSEIKEKVPKPFSKEISIHITIILFT